MGAETVAEKAFASAWQLAHAWVANCLLPIKII